MPAILAADLREQYPSKSALGPISDARIQEQVDAAVDQWERLARIAVSPTTQTISRVGDGRASLVLPHLPVLSVAAVTVDGATLDSSAYWVDPVSGILTLRSGRFTLSYPVEVTYTHGLTEPPGAVVNAILQRALELLIPSELPARTTSVANDLGFNRISIAGRDGSSGIPDFDATAALFGRQAAFHAG